MNWEKPQTEIDFESAIKSSRHNKIISLSKPYMMECSDGYDSPFTNHMYWGFVLGQTYRAGGGE